MRELYEPMAAGRTTARTIAVLFNVDEQCPTHAVAGFCVTATSSYDDTPNAQTTIVNINIGVQHWGLRSYAAMAIILGHELICHGGHGLMSDSRQATMATDAFSEGWMDLVSRTLVLDQARASKRVGVLSLEQVQQTAAEIHAWRIAENWPGPCQRRDKDRTAHVRSRGTDCATFAQFLFSELGDNKGFLTFSATFNAEVLSPSSRNQLICDVEASRELYRPDRAARRTRFERLIRDGDISALLRVWKTEED
jgi:hypothetical protein